MILMDEYLLIHLYSVFCKKKIPFFCSVLHKYNT